MTNFVELARKGRTEALARIGNGAGSRQRSGSIVTFASVRGGR
ncbi:MAG: hypothetical protein U1E48_13325 [Paracoccaceae bacterium]